MTPSDSFDGSAPAGMDAELDSLLAQGGSDSSSGTTEPTPAPTVPELSDPEPEKPAVQATQDQAKPAEQSEDFPLDDEIVGELKDFHGRKKMQFSEENGKALLQQRDFVKSLHEAIPDLTVESAKQHYAAYADMQQLQSAFEANDPVQFMQFWAQRANGNPQAFTGLALEATNALLEVDRDLFENEVATPVVSAKLDFLQDHALRELQQAQASQDEAAIKQAHLNLYAAQRAAWALTGRYKQATGQPQGQDPYAESRKRFEQDKQQFEQARQQEAQNRWNTAQADFKSRLDANTGKLIDTKVSAVEKYFASNPKFKQVTTKYLSGVVQDRLAENKPWMDTLNIDRAKALRAGDAKSLEDVEKRYLSRVESIVVSELRNMIPAETKAAVAKSQQRHAAAQESQRREVTGNGKPVPQSIVTPPGKSGGRMSWEAELDAMLPT